MARIGIFLAALLFSALAAAQYPARAITIIVPIPPGGAPDIAARVIGQKLSENIGQPVVIENRAGANGNIANDLVAKAPPDGYTLGLLADSQITINPHLYKMPIDTLRDLAPVATVAANQFVLTVNPTLPVTTFPEFIEYAKKANPPLAYASGGNGSQHHLTMEMLKQRAGIDLLHVPYKGGAPAAAATVAGDTMAMCVGQLERAADQGRPAARARGFGRAALGAVSRAADDRRVLSGLRELDLARPVRPGRTFRSRRWRNFERKSEKCSSRPTSSEKLNAAGGLDPYLTTPEEFAALIRRDYDKYAKVVKDIGIKLD